MRFSDFGPDGVDGGEVGITDEHRHVGKRLAGWFPHRRSSFAGREGGGQGEREKEGRRVGRVSEN